MILKIISDLETCKAQLLAAFKSELKTTNSFLNSLNNLHQYYYSRCLKSTPTQQNKLLEEYKFLISTINKVKAGTITNQEGIDAVSTLQRDRTITILTHNILKTCELLFWMTSAITSYSLCLGLCIPLIFINPIAGIALTLFCSILMLEATLLGAECVNQYQSFSPPKEQGTLEKNTVIFFASRLPSISEEDETVQVELDASIRL